MTTAGQDRLFVPLTAEAFGWWSRGKRREVRVYGKRWNECHIHPGRLVELRRGYSGPSLWGRIGRVMICAFEDLSDNGVPMIEVAPERVSWLAVRNACGCCSWREQVVAFEVLLDEGQGAGG